MFHVTLPHKALTKTFLESASENSPFEGGLDDHYPSIPKRKRTPNPMQPHVKRRVWSQMVEPRGGTGIGPNTYIGILGDTNYS